MYTHTHFFTGFEYINVCHIVKPTQGYKGYDNVVHPHTHTLHNIYTSNWVGLVYVAVFPSKKQKQNCDPEIVFIHVTHKSSLWTTNSNSNRQITTKLRSHICSISAVGESSLLIDMKWFCITVAGGPFIISNWNLSMQSPTATGESRVCASTWLIFSRRNSSPLF